MNEALYLKALKRVSGKPLKRLKWAVYFSQWDFSEKPEGLSMAEVELTCFTFYGFQELQERFGIPVLKQIKALMKDPYHSYRGQEVLWVQQQFAKVLGAAASDREIEMPLRYVTAKFTRAGGLEYVTTSGLEDSEKQQGELRREHIVFRLLRLLDKTVRTGTKGGEQLTPIRLYVGICPKDKDGCGKLFAKSRTDQNYCSRTCVSRAQVYRFRRNQKALKQLYPGKRMKQLTAAERNRVFQRAESLR